VRIPIKNVKCHNKTRTRQQVSEEQTAHIKWNLWRIEPNYLYTRLGQVN